MQKVLCVPQSKVSSGTDSAWWNTKQTCRFNPTGADLNEWWNAVKTMDQIHARYHILQSTIKSLSNLESHCASMFRTRINYTTQADEA